ncbi:MULTISPECIES: GPO family capsid scaffolding protein [unclassified Methylophaga]|jgi:DNA-binding transcriptional MerR regulator|uniref:GPO family capsid scaffolding protein n=1 Tax=unclassified Methylophaga TaxID=2629249 RepID=UPI00259CD57A|nr:MULTISPECIES: GPO family capsid scaffolding protein [unclassified Methylophaga]|tara:strand:+ start:13345 stop:14241 length:897 start_codon:yes stop_codon:yes gene_type:complete
MAKLKTEWKRIGRSGKTIDGRDIDPQWLRDAAETYDPELYQAKIWPDHIRMYSMGSVVAVRAEENSEGGVDLYAQIAPNEIYQSTARSGQRLHTSMELMPNFRDTGKFYLSGLAATDTPASVATSEMRFTANKDQTIILGEFVENETHNFNDSHNDDQPPRWFTRLFSKDKSDEGDMDKKTAEQLTASMTALSESLAAFKEQLDGKPEGEGKPSGEPEKLEITAERFAALEAEIKELKDAKASHKGGEQASTVDAEAFNKLQTKFDELTKQFKAALEEQPGTNAGEHEGDSFKADDYI